jgi:hypothetical protein
MDATGWKDHQGFGMHLPRARKLVVGSALLCAACVVQPPPPPPVAVAVASPPPQNCREYNAQIMIGGQPQPAYGWACQQPDGSWKISQETPGQPPQVYVVPPNPAYPVGYPYWAYDPYWGPRIAIGGTFVFGGGRGFRHHHEFGRDRGFHRW